MELEEIPLEKKKNGDGERASEMVLEVKTEEEAQPDHYAKLQTPAEDVYAEAFFGDKKAKAGKQTEGNARLYRAGCLFLTLICLVLLLVVIILSVKLQTGSPDCPGSWETGAGTWTTGTNFPNTQRQQTVCNHCGNGWLPFEKSCFHLSTIRMNWSMSKRNCTARGGHLAIISSLSVQTFLTGATNEVFWIGLRHDGNQWKWVDNSALRTSYWEVNAAEAECGLLRGAGPPQKNWMKGNCAHLSYFICEKLP
ncbi:early activation antigen CD69 isoform X1 [Hippoglossus stenolepis]|uniref:early activation antigen CD69 isoform X1 n=1 Tax=Hippoglossus stenolepis TaxID=195615 RepID=UPI00159C906E|nr:early activation antigen CD69 isoform X1 [Hippoglossus stenolepis]